MALFYIPGYLNQFRMSTEWLHFPNRLFWLCFSIARKYYSKVLVFNYLIFEIQPRNCKSLILSVMQHYTLPLVW